MSKPPALKNFDIILQRFKEHRTQELNQMQKDMLDRWNFADNLIRQYENTETIRAMLKEKFGVSESQAWRDIAHAKQFFGTININNKQYYRIFYAEWLEEMARESHLAGDRKNAKDCIKEAAEIRGLKDDDFDPEEYKKRQHNTFIMNLNVSTENSSFRKTIDLDNLDDIKDVEFEELINKIENTTSVSEEDMRKLLERKND